MESLKHAKKDFEIEQDKWHLTRKTVRSAHWRKDFCETDKSILMTAPWARIERLRMLESYCKLYDAKGGVNNCIWCELMGCSLN